MHTIIPAGGAGTRLWPISRQAQPKFLIDLTGSGRTLLQQTYDRLAVLSESITVVTGELHAEQVRAQLPEDTSYGVGGILVEPAPRNSMPAIGLASALIQKQYGPEAIVGSFAADHIIKEPARFQQAVQIAAAAAAEDYIATIGIIPQKVTTSFGYIEMGSALEIDGLFAVESFVEKPEVDQAAEYIASGRYLWNAGMFVAKASVLLEELELNQPRLAAGLNQIAEVAGTSDYAHKLVRIWPDLESIAIDHAIAEPAAARGRVVVVPAEMGWDDLGDFDALAEYLPSEEGIHLAGEPDALQIDSDESLVIDISGHESTIAIAGIPGAVVVRTDSAILVTTRDHAQKVKELVELLGPERKELL